ncbi:MAG: hypothetical protein BRD34_01930 [Bacteroidetes bacterium QH_6_64_77]|nr:MAG: hypothetical protein BRD34_01930 [Bacteroidetes bacterium QH_6_64_77]
MTASARASSVSASEVVERLDQFAYWTDECITIPGLNVRVGLDPIIGLMPAGAPIPLIFTMLAIIMIEAVVGAIPVVGDLVDAAVKSNKINVRMLKDHLGV